MILVIDADRTAQLDIHQELLQQKRIYVHAPIIFLQHIMIVILIFIWRPW